jgi:hypothetical protein
MAATAVTAADVCVTLGVGQLGGFCWGRRQLCGLDQLWQRGVQHLQLH